MLTASQPAALIVIQAPSGRFVFRGSVPAALAYQWEAESDLEAAKQCGPAIAERIAARHGRTFKSVAFDTRESAIAAAAALGHSVA